MTRCSEKQAINRVPVSVICELKTCSEQHKFIELGIRLLDLEETCTAEGQDNNSRLSLSTSSTEVCHNVAQSESNTVDFSEGDHELGSQEKLDINTDTQICDGSSKKEEVKTCENQPSDIADIRKEIFMSFSQDSFDKKESECTDPENMNEDDHSQLCESVSEIDSGLPILESESEFFICENIKCVIPKSLPLLQLLLVNRKESSEERMYIKKMLIPLWKIIATHRHVGPFLIPVKEKQAPGYLEIVKRPMDLRTIKRQLAQGTIKTKAEFQRDVLLMLQNCIMYNNVQHTIHQKALEMQKDVVELLQVLNVQVYQRSKPSN